MFPKFENSLHYRWHNAAILRWHLLLHLHHQLILLVFFLLWLIINTTVFHVFNILQIACGDVCVMRVFFFVFVFMRCVTSSVTATTHGTAFFSHYIHDLRCTQCVLHAQTMGTLQDSLACSTFPAPRAFPTRTLAAAVNPRGNCGGKLRWSGCTSHKVITLKTLILLLLPTVTGHFLQRGYNHTVRCIKLQITTMLQISITFPPFIIFMIIYASIYTSFKHHSHSHYLCSNSRNVHWGSNVLAQK